MDKLKSKHQLCNELFNKKIGSKISKKIELNKNEDTRRIAALLILEEAVEAIEALGFDVIGNEFFIKIVKKQGEKLDLADLIKELCDLRYVTTGALSLCTGAPDEPFQNIVDQNNLSKFDTGYNFDDNGKLLKSPNHKNPKQEIKDLVKKLNSQTEKNTNEQ